MLWWMDAFDTQLEYHHIINALFKFICAVTLLSAVSCSSCHVASF